jgi:LysM repeat protein
MKRRVFAVSLFIFFILLMRMVLVAQASPDPQVLQYATPTPRSDGRIIYIVTSGDSCLRISLLTGVSVEEIRKFNRLNENCDIREGQELLIGFGGPSAGSPTPGPSPTPTQVLPTPTLVSGGKAQICVLLYDDLNGDGKRQETEPPIADGAVSVTNLSGVYSKTQNTLPANPDVEFQGICFIDAPQGEYTVSVGIPDGYNPTTVLSYDLTGAKKVEAGGTYYVPFGAQPSSAPVVNPATASRSPVIAIVGGLMLLIGGGLFWYARQITGGPKRSKFK